MNRIDRLFKEKKNNILSVYFTAGYPALNSTVPVITELVGQGVDMIEIGMPFSDPVADGPVLQEANQTALGNGMSVRKLFEQLKDIRSVTDIPLILMGYLNPVLRYGMVDFCKKCHDTGIDGLILPDLPVEEYAGAYQETFDKNGLYPVFLITPETSAERINLIDRTGKGFIYMVSVSSTTGERKGFSSEQISYFNRVAQMNLRLPRLIGFGISDHGAFVEACQFSSGAIIGSAFVKRISEAGQFIQSIRKASTNG